MRIIRIKKLSVWAIGIGIPFFLVKNAKKFVIVFVVVTTFVQKIEARQSLSFVATESYESVISRNARHFLPIFVVVRYDRTDASIMKIELAIIHDKLVMER
uniref:Uncharacterized protein n=1 Tax=Romanomermis culicivorax TaxID=13658 RepID=A0A915IS95_ROMCU